MSGSIGVDLSEAGTEELVAGVKRSTVGAARAGDDKGDLVGGNVVIPARKGVRQGVAPGFCDHLLLFLLLFPLASPGIHLPARTWRSLRAFHSRTANSSLISPCGPRRNVRQWRRHRISCAGCGWRIEEYTRLQYLLPV